jgi:cytochrome c-type biogenesis protein
MDFTGLLILPLGLGLLGFIEPCSLGSSLLFVRYLEAKDTHTKILETCVFAVTRALFMGSLGVLAAYIGGSFLGLQRWFWIALGLGYAVLGMAYLAGAHTQLLRAFGPTFSSRANKRSAMTLGLAFGLNVPACAAPLLAAVFAASFGAGTMLRGFWVMTVFGTALSLPLIAAASWSRGQTLLEWLAHAASRAPRWTGVILILLGFWSVYLGLNT